MKAHDDEIDRCAAAVTAPVQRRTILRAGATALGTALLTLDTTGLISSVPMRQALAEDSDDLPDIQYDLDRFTPPAIDLNGTAFRFGPVHNVFLTAKLRRKPSRDDREIFAHAVDLIEDAYPFSPSGVFAAIAYGLPYFRRLPRSLVSQAMPRLLSHHDRWAFEEAVPGPTDVHKRNRGIRKRRFNIPVRIEDNDLLFTFRSDDSHHLKDVFDWLQGSDRLRGRSVRSPRLDGLLRFTSTRVMFGQRGIPRRIAENAKLPYAWLIHPQSPMWMGFADQQVAGSGPAAITTFAGSKSARFTTAKRGDYFDNASIQHLSHVILDLEQYYGVSKAGQKPGGAASYVERVQLMFHSPPMSQGKKGDLYTDGGGTAFLPNMHKGAKDAENAARGIGTPNHVHRLGHTSALQRVSRAKDGTPIHVRLDGPGFDTLDVPGGKRAPKLHFSSFVPTSDFFARMRVAQASLDLAKKYDVKDAHNGLERFMTTTRRQNFLVPPRRHRIFPLLEFTNFTDAGSREGLVDSREETFEPRGRLMGDDGGDD